MDETSTASILVVDDVPDNIEIVESILGRAGYRLFSADSGQAAIELCRVQAFDLILLDVMMPEMDGFEACRQMRTMPGVEYVPVVFLTAKTDLDSIVEGFEAGGADYVTKPFYAKELQARVRTQVRLWQTERELRRLNAAKDRFLGLIGSELKRPFSALQGVLGALVEGAEDMDRATLQDYARLAEDAALNLGLLMDNLQQWTDQQTERVPPHPRELLAETALTDALDAERELLAVKGVAARIETTPGADELKVLADRQMLSTVLRNLLTNAAKFSHPGGRVELSAHAENDRVIFSVADEGIGVAAADREKLFTPGAQFRRAGTQGELGVGVGLALCRELVEENGGEIWLQGAAEKGLQVVFSLPAPDEQTVA